MNIYSYVGFIIFLSFRFVKYFLNFFGCAEERGDRVLEAKNQQRGNSRASLSLLGKVAFASAKDERVFKSQQLTSSF